MALPRSLSTAALGLAIVALAGCSSGTSQADHSHQPSSSSSSAGTTAPAPSSAAPSSAASSSTTSGGSSSSPSSSGPAGQPLSAATLAAIAAAQRVGGAAPTVISSDKAVAELGALAKSGLIKPAECAVLLDSLGSQLSSREAALATWTSIDASLALYSTSTDKATGYVTTRNEAVKKCPTLTVDVFGTSATGTVKASPVTIAGASDAVLVVISDQGQAAFHQLTARVGGTLVAVSMDPAKDPDAKQAAQLLASVATQLAAAK